MLPRISKEGLTKSLNVVLRVPALFIAEVWWKTDPSDVHSQFNDELAHVASNTSQELFIQVAYYFVIGFCITLTVLPLQRLVTLYMYIACGFLVSVAHYLSWNYVNTEKSHAFSTSATEVLDELPISEDSSALRRLAAHLATQVVIAAMIVCLAQVKNWSRFALLLYTIPGFARMCNFQLEDVHRFHNLAAIAVLTMVVFFLLNQLPALLDMCKLGITELLLSVEVYGWIPFIIDMWFKILLPVQFLLFWCIIFMFHMYKYFSAANHLVIAGSLKVVMVSGMAECCTSPFSLIGLCITISYISYIVLLLTKIFLMGKEGYLQDNVTERGWTEGFTMFLLSIQTGLIELESAPRAFLLSIVLFIVISSLIQSMYEIAEPILLSLAASQNKNKMKHVQAVFLCTLLWMCPLYMTWTICQFFELDFWLLVVISSCALTSVQVFGTLAIYALFMYDGLRDEPWENLDDVVYYAKGTTRVLEFLVAVFVVCYGVYESIFGEWSWVNCSILLIHCYFNVWQRLQVGWKSYLLRRHAIKKIEALPFATHEQLDNLDDVCAICFQELNIARVTPCHHFFHGKCLKKWLYIQDHCPLCHQRVTPPPESFMSEEDWVNHHNIPGNNPHRPDPVPPRSRGNAEHPASSTDQNGVGPRHRRPNQDNVAASGPQDVQHCPSHQGNSDVHSSSSTDGMLLNNNNVGLQNGSSTHCIHVQHQN